MSDIPRPAWLANVSSKELPPLDSVDVTRLKDLDKNRKDYIPIVCMEQAAGAIKNGAIIEKINSKPGDSHTDGARAKVMGSMGPIDLPGLGMMYGYWVEWEDAPGFPVMITGNRVKLISG